jgi:2',3'-cyclic-nucleotide 2'-phosphodiesterase
MNILFIGDIFGSLGRDLVEKYIKKIKDDYQINYVIANGENAAHGRGITEAIYKSFLTQGIQVVTLGNHSFDNRDIFNFIDDAKNIIRPANSDISVPGRGYGIYNYNGIKVAVINLMGRVYMPPMNDPFRTFDQIYEDIKNQVDIIFVDFHAEATSEKLAFGYYVDGRATVVVGTHTHVPTADNRILEKGTAYISDVGMTGPLNGVIGMEKEAVISRFLNNLPVRFNPVDEGDGQLNAVVIQIDPKTKRAKKIERINIIDKKVIF